MPHRLGHTPREGSTCPVSVQAGPYGAHGGSHTRHAPASCASCAWPGLPTDRGRLAVTSYPRTVDSPAVCASFILATAASPNTRGVFVGRSLCQDESHGSATKVLNIRCHKASVPQTDVVIPWGRSWFHHIVLIWCAPQIDRALCDTHSFWIGP